MGEADGGLDYGLLEEFNGNRCRETKSIYIISNNEKPKDSRYDILSKLKKLIKI